MAVRSCLGSFLVRFVSLSLSFAVESQRAAFESVFTISDLTLFRCVCFNDSFFHADERVSKRSGVPRLLKRITRKQTRFPLACTTCGGKSHAPHSSLSSREWKERPLTPPHTHTHTRFSNPLPIFAEKIAKTRRIRRGATFYIFCLCVLRSHSALTSSAPHQTFFFFIF